MLLNPSGLSLVKLDGLFIVCLSCCRRQHVVCKLNVGNGSAGDFCSMLVKHRVGQ